MHVNAFAFLNDQDSSLVSVWIRAGEVIDYLSFVLFSSLQRAQSISEVRSERPSCIAHLLNMRLLPLYFN